MGETLARVLQSPAPGASIPPAPALPGASLQPDAVMVPEEDGELAKVRRLHQVVGKSITNLIDGLLQRSCRWAGRDPGEMDDDERALIAEGSTELAAIYLGKKKLTPGGKVLAGAVISGVGMYMGGTPIPKKAAPPLKLVPPGAPAQQQQQAPGPEDGDQGA